MGRVARRVIGGLLFAALLVASAGFYAYSPFLIETLGRGPATSAEPGVRSSPTIAPTPTPTATETPSGPTVASSPDPDRPPGPGGTEPGIRLQATFRSGTFEVVETVRLPAAATSLSLAPPDLGPAGSNLRTARAVATDLVVRVQERSVRLRSRTIERPTVISLATATDTIELRYRLRGVVRLSRPSRSGRALGAVGPLTSLPAQRPVAVSFRAEAIRNLRCPSLPIDEQSCVAGKRPRLRVNQNLERQYALVLVQLDLQAGQGDGPR